ncbi:MAG TPA: hypothetical protein VIQ30_04205 [Pseudonocardia sp.]|jgi:hypothetical protein
MSAARRYKDITGGMTDAVARMRRSDIEVAARLESALPEMEEAMRVAAERAALSELGVGLQWEAALESLWGEHWMTLRPLPRPDRRVAPRDLDYLDAVVAKRYETLVGLIRRRPVLGRR